jgi:hypothetical protein
MRAEQLRTRTVGCKVTASEYQRLEAAASGEAMKLGEWIRKELLERAEGRKASLIEQTLLAEMLALRTILLNLHFTVAKGEPLTAEYMRTIIERADATKVQKAAGRLEQRKSKSETVAPATPSSDR